MDWAEVLSGEGDIVKATGFSWCEFDLAHLAQPLSVWRSQDEARLDADAVVPPAVSEPSHELCVAEPPVRQQADLSETKEVEHSLDFGQDGQQLSRADLSTGMFEDARDERYRSSPEQDRNANQAELLEQDTGVQGQDQRVLAPVAQGTGHEWTVNGGGVDGWILQPPTKAAFRALGEGGTGVDVRQPGCKRCTLGQQETGDHPGERPGVADVVPQPLLEMSQDSLVESGSVPGGIFGCHRQKVSPTGDAFSYFLSGSQATEVSIHRDEERVLAQTRATLLGLWNKPQHGWSVQRDRVVIPLRDDLRVGAALARNIPDSLLMSGSTNGQLVVQREGLERLMGVRLGRPWWKLT